MSEERFTDAQANEWRRGVILGRREDVRRLLEEARELIRTAFLQLLAEPLAAAPLAVLDLYRKAEGTEIYLREQWAKDGQEERRGAGGAMSQDVWRGLAWLGRVGRLVAWRARRK